MLENVFRVVGWADVHYPCEGIFKAYVRIGLPAEYRGKVAGKVATYAVRRILDWLDIPQHERYAAGLYIGAEELPA